MAHQPQHRAEDTVEVIDPSTESDSDSDVRVKKGPGCSTEILRLRDCSQHTWPIPDWFAKRYMSRKKKRCIVVDADGRRYRCKVDWHPVKKYKCSISGAWFNFMRNNNVMVEDSVVLHPTRKLHVFEGDMVRGRTYMMSLGK